jgi:pimeloyl-ACP methyl ester carboxylesterase
MGGEIGFMSPRRSEAVKLVTLVLLAAFAAACATPVGARRVSGRDADRRVAANVLATGEPSAPALQVLHRHDLLELYREDRGAALEQLHATLAEPDLEIERMRARLFALAELSFDHARHEEQRFAWVRDTDPRPWFLASAIYAAGFVSLEPTGSANLLAFDSRTRLAADLYNRGLTEGLKEGGELQIADGVRALPFGTLSIDLDESTLRWGSFVLKDFVPTAEYQTRGISNRYRHAGIGAPVAASVELAPDADGVDAERVGKSARVGATLLLYTGFSLEALNAGEFHGRLEIHTADVGRELTIEGRPVPLEVDSTAALALRLDRFDATSASIRAFLSGDLSALTSGNITDQLGMFGPYRKGRIPVVFVHGTNSSPSTWVELLNELENDPILSDRLQYWFFFYASGAPIGYSGGLLAAALRHLTEQLDPNGTDPALDNLVVIGHSQGGLLTKLSVIDSGMRFWNRSFKKPPEELSVSEATRELLERSLIFEPVESVSRVIFISTPHGGSFLTKNPLSNLVGNLISIPTSVGERVTDLLRQDPDALAISTLRVHTTSLDNMRPGNAFLETLRELDVDAGVAVHSIVAVQGDGPKEELSDGVVEYLSAHIARGSELLVHSGHSAQVHPASIAEVRRILREHLAALEARPE